MNELILKFKKIFNGKKIFPYAGNLNISKKKIKDLIKLKKPEAFFLNRHSTRQFVKKIIKKDIFDGQVYNVLTQNTTVHEVVDTIRILIPELKIEFVDTKIMNQLSYEVLCDRFMSTNFKFSGSLKRGIEETISLLKNANKI